MKPRDLCAGMIVIVIWGLSFVVTKTALAVVPPLFLCFLRFGLTALPLSLLIRPRGLSWMKIIPYGIAMFTLQFALLFVGLRLGVAAGLAAIAMQSQVFITIALAAVLLGERIQRHQLIGALIGFGGIVVIALHPGQDISPWGLPCILLAALCWSWANVFAKRCGEIDRLGLVAWGALFAAPPLLALSLLIEGPGKITAAVRQLDLVSIMAVFYLAYPATLLAYAIWNQLLTRYPAGTVAPLTLLTPVVGLTASVKLLNERISGWELEGAAMVIVGLTLNVAGDWVSDRNPPPATTPR